MNLSAAISSFLFLVSQKIFLLSKVVSAIPPSKRTRLARRRFFALCCEGAIPVLTSQDLPPRISERGANPEPTHRHILVAMKRGEQSRSTQTLVTAHRPPTPNCGRRSPAISCALQVKNSIHFNQDMMFNHTHKLPTTVTSLGKLGTSRSRSWTTTYFYNNTFAQSCPTRSPEKESRRKHGPKSTYDNHYGLSHKAKEHEFSDSVLFDGETAMSGASGKWEGRFTMLRGRRCSSRLSIKGEDVEVIWHVSRGSASKRLVTGLPNMLPERVTRGAILALPTRAPCSCQRCTKYLGGKQSTAQKWSSNAQEVFRPGSQFPSWILMLCLSRVRTGVEMRNPKEDGASSPRP